MSETERPGEVGRPAAALRSGEAGQLAGAVRPGEAARPKRNTWQREAVRAALAEARGFVSAQQLHQTLREQGSTIGLATVYRGLASLAEEGEADSLQSPAGESLYRTCVTPGHHHHLICRECGDTRELEAKPVEEWAQRVGAEHGFTEMDHVIDLFGVCAKCREGAAAS